MSSRPSQTSARPKPAKGRAQPTTARGPRLGALASLLLHGAVVASMIVAFQHNLGVSEESHMIPVELVTIAARTNVPAPEPSKPEEMSPPPMPDLARAEPAPDIQPPKVAIEEPKKQDDLAALLNKLSAPSTKPARITPAQSSAASGLTTSTLDDAFRSQVKNCWSPIAGAPNPADQIVSFDLRLNPDGTISDIETLTGSGNPYTAAAISAARRAIYQCQPYHLPPERYADWREINPLRFDPRQMMQQ